ncbi:hypothetical protein BIW11_11991 [Tropilaelaps mercedesae]|uniref:Uncharacterized protein n=1 Tax=Tropilaelaps mercedesae TaxID=418985 RepID=A0A1V9X989_9ACAR|nr:hypothetical protein BIW11_11991 [Tropilaelaps mercedesae]
MADDYETHVDVPLEPAIRRLLLERRASRSEDLPEELDGFRFDRRRSVDYKEFKDYRNLAEEERQHRHDTSIIARPVDSKRA